ncbi:adenosylcobinamide-GDP ribazoletransferase, partial [Acinetobacter baumannii]
TLWIWLTGGLHLDGLADTADAWVGGFGDKQRTLQIMKDPSCGPIGVLSLVIICLLKFALVFVLIDQHQTLFLVFVPAL